jgi:hypothetical protein
LKRTSCFSPSNAANPPSECPATATLVRSNLPANGPLASSFRRASHPPRISSPSSIMRSNSLRPFNLDGLTCREELWSLLREGAARSAAA